MEKLIKALPTLLEKQQELDDYIMRERFLTHDETIEQRKLAFIVELAELAQEWRGFKYWSDNQEPSDKMLEEYVDVLHFALSLHNYYGGDESTNFTIFSTECAVKKQSDEKSDPLNEFSSIVRQNIDYSWNSGVSLHKVLILSAHLKLMPDDILKEYDRKYQINIERQNNGY